MRETAACCHLKGASGQLYFHLKTASQHPHPNSHGHPQVRQHHWAPSGHLHKLDRQFCARA